MGCSRRTCQTHRHPWFKVGATCDRDRGLDRHHLPVRRIVDFRFSLIFWLPGYGPSFSSLFAPLLNRPTMSSHSDRNHHFLFTLLSLRGTDSARKVTIRRVYDVCMHSLCLGDVERARKAFGILLRCKEFDWKASWSLAIYMLNAHGPERDDAFFLSQVERLRSLMLRDPTQVSCSSLPNVRV